MVCFDLGGRDEFTPRWLWVGYLPQCMLTKWRRDTILATLYLKTQQNTCIAIINLAFVLYCYNCIWHTAMVTWSQMLCFFFIKFQLPAHAVVYAVCFLFILHANWGMPNWATTLIDQLKLLRNWAYRNMDSAMKDIHLNAIFVRSTELWICPC